MITERSKLSMSGASTGNEVWLRYSVEGRVKSRLELDCRFGTLTVLEDDTGHYSKCCVAALDYSNRTVNTIFVGSDPVNDSEIARVGLGDRLPHKSISEVLISYGVEEQKIPDILEKFELTDWGHLTADRLPPVPARRLALLTALYSPAPVLLLNDPFQPFNGRWREQLGQYILEDVVKRKRVAICLNVGFYPKCWSSSTDVIERNLARLTEEAIEREALRLEQAAKLAAERIKQLEREAAASVPDNQPGAEEIPAFLIPYKSTMPDWLFEPMARITNLFRAWRGVLATSGLAFVVMSIGIMMYPEAIRGNPIVAKLAATLHWEWKDVGTAIKDGMKDASDPHILGGGAEGEEKSAEEPDDEAALSIDPDAEVLDISTDTDGNTGYYEEYLSEDQMLSLYSSLLPDWTEDHAGWCDAEQRPWLTAWNESPDASSYNVSDVSEISDNQGPGQLLPTTSESLAE